MHLTKTKAKQTLTRLVLVVSLWMMSIVGASAQSDITVKGVVTDNLGEAIVGASVVVKGQTSIRAITDMDGNFALKVPSEKSTLVISYIGMQSQEVRVGKQRKLNITLEDDNQQLSEVVVVGYGQQKRPAWWAPSHRPMPRRYSERVV